MDTLILIVVCGYLIITLGAYLLRYAKPLSPRVLGFRYLIVGTSFLAGVQVLMLFDAFGKRGLPDEGPLAAAAPPSRGILAHPQLCNPATFDQLIYYGDVP